jgi:hypothetical protein
MGATHPLRAPSRLLLPATRFASAPALRRAGHHPDGEGQSDASLRVALARDHQRAGGDDGRKGDRSRFGLTRKTRGALFTERPSSATIVWFSPAYRNALAAFLLAREGIRSTCSSVAQWQSIRLLTGGLLVRVQPEEPTRCAGGALRPGKRESSPRHRLASATKSSSSPCGRGPRLLPRHCRRRWPPASARRRRYSRTTFAPETARRTRPHLTMARSSSCGPQTCVVRDR